MDPKLHPFEKAREYTRALTAVKMDRMFAQPFLAALDDHTDGVYSSATSPTSLVSFVSGAADGEVIVWDLALRQKLWSVYAHRGFVRGLSVASDGDTFFSCGDDRIIRQWRMAAQARDAAAAVASSGSKRPRAAATPAEGDETGDKAAEVEPLATWGGGKSAYTYIDCHWANPARFATSSLAVNVWDTGRSEPIHTYSWGADTVTTVRFNPAEHGILATTGSDRSICLYDTRTDSALRKVVMSMSANALAWNPREPFNFAVASEDHNVYTFDMRRLNHSLMVHKDHVGAVMDVSFAPTGKEFVTGSYDRTVRIWASDAGRSREIYHTKRMQRVFTVQYSRDAKYVISGSDDTNVRIWKAHASTPLGRLLPRERAHLDYLGALKKRFAHMPDVRRIATARHVPKPILKARRMGQEAEERTRKKLANVRAHSAPGSGAGIPEPERKKRIVGEFR